MRPNTLLVSVALGLLLSAGAGYRIGTRQWPFLEQHNHSGPKPSPSVAREKERKVLYYRNPMGHPDTSPVPKKDEMGMDYIPVYEDEEQASDTSVKISLDKVQRAGVRTTEAKLESLSRPVRAAGIAKPDERTLRSISLRSEGFIEKLYANEKGRYIRAGDPLFRVYSQEMLRALVDYRLGGRDAGAPQTLLSAEQKLRNLEVPDSAIAEARKAREVPMSFDWPAPVSGYIMEKNIIEGQMAKMGEELFRISDLSTIWVMTSVAEQDIHGIKEGDPAKVEFLALPGVQFDGKVTLILHELDESTRTAQVRVEVANPGDRIRHEMYASVTIDTSLHTDRRITVPTSAVIDSGNRQVVLVELGEGRFEPRNVKLGMRGGDLIEITEGLKAGEKVVVSANFLIDAESNLKAALSSFAQDTKERNEKEPQQ